VTIDIDDVDQFCLLDEKFFKLGIDRSVSITNSENNVHFTSVLLVDLAEVESICC